MKMKRKDFEKMDLQDLYDLFAVTKGWLRDRLIEKISLFKIERVKATQFYSESNKWPFRNIDSYIEHLNKSFP